MALVLLAVLSAVLPAVADEIAVPEDATPIVGMAYDASHDELWLAGPQADRGVLVDAEGSKEVTFGADLESVQALGWFGDRLWVADIGDAAGVRDHVVVYRLGSTDGGRTTYHAYDFEYEDGPRDAQAMLISGRGNIYFVTAGANPGIYRVEGDASRERVNTLVRVHDAPAGVTDAVFLSDGSTMALRTAAGIEYLDALAWQPLVTETLVGAPEGESIALGIDDELFVGGNPTVRTAQVVSADVTTTIGPEEPVSPSPDPLETTATVDPSEQASATAEPPADPNASDEPGPARAGTITALVLAGLVALGAGAVTYFWRN